MHEAGWGIAGGLVGVGIAWGVMKATVSQLRRDLNGIGSRMREVEKKSDIRFHNVSLAMMHISPVEKEKEVCDFLREG